MATKIRAYSRLLSGEVVNGVQLSDKARRIMAERIVGIYVFDCLHRGGSICRIIGRVASVEDGQVTCELYEDMPFTEARFETNMAVRTDGDSVTIEQVSIKAV